MAPHYQKIYKFKMRELKPRNTQGVFIKKGKSCGCLIASNVISLEVQKRKKKIESEKLRKRIAKAKDKKSISNLRKKHKKLHHSIMELNKHKKTMKKRFDDYVRNSGYMPPRSKKRR